MAQNITKSKFLDLNCGNSQQILENIQKYINKFDCPQMTIDLTRLNILDAAKVIFGDNVFVGPNCGFYTTHHPIETEARICGYAYASPIIIGNNVWIGGNVVVLPGVTIGANTVIGAGSVVNRNIPENVIAAGNPCKVLKRI